MVVGNAFRAIWLAALETDALREARTGWALLSAVSGGVAAPPYRVGARSPERRLAVGFGVTKKLKAD